MEITNVKICTRESMGNVYYILLGTPLTTDERFEENEILFETPFLDEIKRYMQQNGIILQNKEVKLEFLETSHSACAYITCCIEDVLLLNTFVNESNLISFKSQPEYFNELNNDLCEICFCIDITYGSDYKKEKTILELLIELLR